MLAQPVSSHVINQRHHAAGAPGMLSKDVGANIMHNLSSESILNDFFMNKEGSLHWSNN